MAIQDRNHPDPKNSEDTVTAVEDDNGLPEVVRISVVAGPDQGTVFELPRGSHTAGTSEDCRVRLEDRSISRRHLELVVGERWIEARDLGSKNGSFFLGTRFEVIRIGPGAQLRLGTTVLRVHGSEPRRPLHPSSFYRGMLGGSVSMRQVFAQLERIAGSVVSVLVVGESGTGKELVAQAIHEASGRRGPFVVCDLSAVPVGVVESELFGHSRGAFTGADRDREGHFESASRGTIFLDEVGEAPLQVQLRLLRVIDTGVFRRLGEASDRRSTARVVSATNRDISTDVEHGRFRRDLYHRLAGAMITLPPLRERREDIELLVRHFLAQVSDPSGARPPPSVSPDAARALTGYEWPGNVRQLKNVLVRAAALVGKDGVIDLELLGFPEPPSDLEAPVPTAAKPGVPFKEAKEALVHAWEREYVTRLVERHGGNVSLAAQSAGINRVHLHRLIRKYGRREG